VAEIMQYRTQRRLTQRRKDSKEKPSREALRMAFPSGFAALREKGFPLLFAPWRLCVKPAFAVGAAA
jgi:hypothetical protein